MDVKVTTTDGTVHFINDLKRILYRDNLGTPLIISPESYQSFLPNKMLDNFYAFIGTEIKCFNGEHLMKIEFID